VPFPPPPPFLPITSFEVKTVGGIPAPTFHWQVKHKDSKSWGNFQGTILKAGAPMPKRKLQFDPISNKFASKPDPEADKVNAQTSIDVVSYGPVSSGDTYRCAITNAAGTVYSAEVQVTVFKPIPAAILKQPTAVVVNVGQNAQFVVETKGDPEPIYQWKMEDVQTGKTITLKDDANFSGTSSATLTVVSPTERMSDDAFLCYISNEFTGSEPLRTNRVTLRVK